MKISAGSVDHDQLGGVGTGDHHALQHAIDSGASHTGDITNTQHGTISQSNAHAHANLSSVTSDQHHAQAHTLASHSSEAHSELSSVGANDHHAQTHSHSSHSSVGANDHHTADPAGSITMYGASSAPTGYLLCDGAAVSRSTYAGLFGAISTAYGVGDGSSTFNVPDMRSRLPVGEGSGSGLTARALGATGGAETHALVSGELAAHVHTISRSDNTGYTGPFRGGGAHTAYENTGSVGSGTAHENMSPFLGVNFIIKT